MREIVLYHEQVVCRPVVTLRPDVTAGGNFDELGVHANMLAHGLDAALENGFHPEVATNWHVDRIALIESVEFRAMTIKSLDWERSVMMSSVIPSAKRSHLRIGPNVLERQDCN